MKGKTVAFFITTHVAVNFWWAWGAGFITDVNWLILPAAATIGSLFFVAVWIGDNW